MTPGLQAFADKDAGFRQFIKRYETVSADLQTRQEYAVWFDEALREEGMLDWARQEGRDEIIPRLAESEQQRLKAERKLLGAAKSMKDQGIPIATIKIAFPSLASEIEKL